MLTLHAKARIRLLHFQEDLIPRWPFAQQSQDCSESLDPFIMLARTVQPSAVHSFCPSAPPLIRIQRLCVKAAAVSNVSQSSSRAGNAEDITRRGALLSCTGALLMTAAAVAPTPALADDGEH